jgi:CheY-like chemotaxis protein
MKVLIVDDSISVRKALEKILVPQDFQVFSAENAEKALSMMAATQPDLVVADVVMPGMTGFELCQSLKQDAAYRAIPLLLISGIVNANVETQARQVGAIGVVKKPFTPDELLPKIKNALLKYPPKTVMPIQAESRQSIAAPPVQQPSTPIYSAPPLSAHPSQPQTEPIKAINPEPAKSESAKPEPAKSEAVKPEAVKPEAIKQEAVKPAQLKPIIPTIAKVLSAKPMAKPAMVLDSERQQALSKVLNPILEKTDVLTVLIVDEGGHCIMSMGNAISDSQTLASYIKFLTSASGVLGENLGDADLKSLVLEYAQRCVVVTRIHKVAVGLILNDMSTLSIARYVLKKAIVEVGDILEGKVSA